MKYNHKHEWNESKEKTYVLAVFFRSLIPTKTFNKKIEILQLKGIFERWAKCVMEIDVQIYSDEFIYHAQQHGFKFKQTHADPYGDPVGFLNISNKDIVRIEKNEKLRSSTKNN